jgi:hypothetical protein
MHEESIRIANMHPVSSILHLFSFETRFSPAAQFPGPPEAIRSQGQSSVVIHSLAMLNGHVVTCWYLA